MGSSISIRKSRESGLTLRSQSLENPSGGNAMKKTLLVTLISLTFAISPLYATQSLSISGPGSWTPGTSLVLSVQDTYANFGGSYGLSYWFEISENIAPFVTITGLTYFTFTNGNNMGTFPFSFFAPSGDFGFLTTLTANGQSGDLGGTSNPLTIIPDGSYHVTDITFAIAANAPAGSYTLRTTALSPRSSIQVTSDFGDAFFPRASFVFTVVPEPSMLALIALTGIGAGVMAYWRRK
jgi:hypothetical protein